MTKEIIGRYTLDLKWKDMLENSQLEEEEDYYIFKNRIFLCVPTDIKELESFITRLFSITE